jgi:hypothetical protein
VPDQWTDDEAVRALGEMLDAEPADPNLFPKDWA